MNCKKKFLCIVMRRGKCNLIRTDFDAASFFLEGLSQIRSLGLVIIYLHRSESIWVEIYLTIRSCSSKASRFVLVIVIFLTRLENIGVVPLLSRANDDA